MKDHPMKEIMNSAINKIREIVDVDTIIGKPIISPDGTMVVPVSKVGFGFGSGGTDIPYKTEKDELFGGGCGAGVSIQPLAFLVISNGDVKLLQMNTNDSTSERAVGMVPDVIDKIYDIFSKERKHKEEKKEKEDIKSEEEEILEDIN